MYSRISQFFHEYDAISEWKTVYQILDKIINEKPKHISIPGLIGKLYGFAEDAMVPVSACLTLVFASIVVMDDLLDGDGRFSEGGNTPAELANMSTAMAAAAIQIVHDFSTADANKILIASLLSEMLFKVAHGQALDVLNPVSEEGYWEVVGLKSGAFFSGAFSLGGAVCDVEGDALRILNDLGYEYGILIQIHDDLRDSLAVPADADWENGRYPLPILFAETVDHPWQERFKAVRAQVGEPHILNEVQEILLRCGAVSYGMYEIERHYADAMHLVQQLKVKDNSLLIKAFDELVQPVEGLIEGLDVHS